MDEKRNSEGCHKLATSKIFLAPFRFDALAHFHLSDPLSPRLHPIKPRRLNRALYPLTLEHPFLHTTLIMPCFHINKSTCPYNLWTTCRRPKNLEVSTLMLPAHAPRSTHLSRCVYPMHCHLLPCGACTDSSPPRPPSGRSTANCGAIKVTFPTFGPCLSQMPMGREPPCG